MDALVAFGAALVALRLSGRLLGRWRARRRPELAAWAASLGCYAVAAAALAWGAAAGWSEAPFRLYYLFGGLLTAALLGTGSLLLRGVRWAAPVALAYSGLAAGVALAEPLRAPVSGSGIPEAAEHLDLFPARVLAIAANSAGTLAVVAVALATMRRRPLGNALVVAGVVAAAAGSALFGTGVTSSAASIAVAVLLLYGGFVLPGTGLRGHRARVASDEASEHERLRREGDDVARPTR